MVLGRNPSTFTVNKKEKEFKNKMNFLEDNENKIENDKKIFGN